MIIPPIFSYAEIHYRFKYFFSFLKTKEPEILFDAPYRIEPDSDLPLLFLIKDADLFPVQIRSVKITISNSVSALHHIEHFFNPALIINTHYWQDFFPIPFTAEIENYFGMLFIDVECEYFVNGRIKKCKNNNYRTATKNPLRVYRSKNHLPSFTGWIHGEIHSHSHYTEDQVEFGVPITAAKKLSSALGLKYFCVTDHSYDLDDSLNSYLKNDAELPKWKLFQEEVERENNTQQEPTVVRGEEVSARNSHGKNVHFLLYGSKKYFPGSGDSAEKWFRTTSELSISDIIKNSDPETVLYAGHPTEQVPFLQKIFLGRDEWHLADMSLQGLHGIQILNGEMNSTFSSGFSIWKSLLLQGKKLFLAAGNDAHGNFNRYIQLGIPFLFIHEKETQIFGRMKTVVHVKQNSENEILQALRFGKSIITNGPVVLHEIENKYQQSAEMGGMLEGKLIIVKLRGRSSEEFGEFSSLKIIKGVIEQTETVFAEITEFATPYEFHFITEWQPIESFSYIRIEASTKNGKGKDAESFCYTNPIWILPE